MAYDSIEPFGEYRDDLRAGIIASTIGNAFRGKGSKPFKPEDFMPRFSSTQRPQQTVEQMHAIWREFVEAHNAALKRQQGGGTDARGGAAP